MNKKIYLISCMMSMILFMSCGSNSSQNAKQTADSTEVSALEEMADSAVAEGNDDQTKTEITTRVKEIYTDVCEKESKMENTESLKKYLSTNFKNLEKKAVAKDQMAVDFDYWIFAQDMDKLTLVSVTDVTVKDEQHATAKVTINDTMAGKKSITLSLFFESGEWLIDDLENDGTSIRSLYEGALQS